MYTVAVKKKLTFRSMKTIVVPSCVIVFALSSARGVTVYVMPTVSFLRTHERTYDHLEPFTR